MAVVKLPAEAEAYKVQTIAEGKRTKTLEGAKAEAEKVKLVGTADARAIEAIGRAEAEQMRLKAEAYRQYGDAAIMSLVLKALPQVWQKRLSIYQKFFFNRENVFLFKDCL